MAKKYLILDCNYLCHRAKHTMGHLSYDGGATGVVYGFLKGLTFYQDLFNTSNFVFCFDSRSSKREEIYPEYKANRDNREYTDDEIAFENAFRKQIRKLRTTYLPRIGFSNIFMQRGYESDDLIAEICLHSLSIGDDAVIITSDKDLYQCLESNVLMYNPQTHKTMTVMQFKKEYGIYPNQWARVKSLAGCSTDNIKGIHGVGEKTAIKFVKKTLSATSKAYKSIMSDVSVSYYENERLVKLPMQGTQGCKLRHDNLSMNGWKEVTKMLGMKSINDKFPFGRR